MILNVEMYNDHIRQTKELHLTSSQLEETVKHYEYKGEKRVVDEQVENLPWFNSYEKKIAMKETKMVVKAYRKGKYYYFVDIAKK